MNFYRFSAAIILLFLSLTTFSQQWGYATLIAPQNQTTVSLIDTNSQVIKTWTGLSGSTAYSCYLMPGGYLWRSVKTTNNSFMGGGLAGRVQKVDWNGNIIFDYTISNTTEISHHDICPMPNGDVLLIVYVKKTAAQMTAAGASSNTARQLEKIVQLHPTGTNTATIVWQWEVYDHLVQNTNVNGANYQSSIVNNPQLLNVNYQVSNDWIHMNGIDYNAELDQIAVSSHNLNEIWIIDHSTTTAQAASHSGGNSGKGGDFLYRWGKPAVYGATGTTIFNVVHDAHWVPANCPRAGWLCGFNNKGVSANQTAVDLWQSTWNGSSYTHTLGQQFLPTTYGYRHAANGYTSNMGNSQQLPNGNMLVCLATAGKIYEIDSNGTQLWQYQGTGTYSHSYRYDRCFIENPSLSITNVNPSVCLGSSSGITLNTSVTATNASGYNYQWSPSAGLSSSTVSNPVVSGLTAPQTYTVTVTTGSGGCTATASVTVNVNPAPPVSAGNNVSISQGQSTILTATGASTYQWSNGSTSSSNTVSPSSTTTYTVTGTDVAGCSATATVTVSVTGGALSVTVSANPNPVCVNSSVQLSALGSGGSGNYTYSWTSNPAGFISSLQNPILTAQQTTTYTVVVSDGNTTASASTTLNVNPLPTVNAGSDVNIQFGNSTVLTAVGTATTFNWSNNVSGASQTVSPTTTTIYTVTGTDANNCSATDQVEVSVSGAPLSIQLSAADSSICEGEATQLFATASGGTGNYTYNWSSNPVGFSSSLNNPYINPVVSTTYTVTVSDGSSTATATLNIIVLTLPTQPSVSLVNDTLLSSSSTINNVWYFYGNPTGDSTQVMDPFLPGSYQVQVIGANGCASPLSEPYEYFPNSIYSVSEKFITIFPNPAHSKVFIQSEEMFVSEIDIFDLQGRLVLQNNNENWIAVQGLIRGMYLIKIKTRDQIFSQRLIIE